MEYIWNLINYICGVWIVSRDDVLVIEDRRPTLRTALAFGLLIALIVVMAQSWLAHNLKFDAWTISLFAAIFVVAVFLAVKDNFREVYVFNKKTDTFTFTRQSVLNKDVLEGSASQFRAVQVERRVTKGGSFDKTTYMVALLVGGMLFGQSDTQVLRETPPFLNFLSTEKRIANAIAKFLAIPLQSVVDVL